MIFFFMKKYFKKKKKLTKFICMAHKYSVSLQIKFKHNHVYSHAFIKN